MASVERPAATVRSIACDQMDYLRENPDACANGNVHGWAWICHVDGEWRATKYGGEHRLKRYVDGDVLDETTVLDWMVSKPVKLVPVTEATLWGPSKNTVWEDADEQDVFTDAERCFWCGRSENDRNLDRYQTTEQGECLFCEDCYESWERAGEIADEVVPTDV